MIQFLREDELLSEDVVRANWRRGYNEIFGNHDGYGFLVEDFTSISHENVNEAQYAYRALQHSNNMNGGRYVCDRLPYAIDTSNNTPREVPYLNALPILGERTEFRMMSRIENRLTLSVPELLQYDLVHLDAAYRKYVDIQHKVKVGPMAMRRVIRYEDLIVARIYQELDYEYIVEINFRETYTKPQLYCRYCQMILFEHLRESNHCALCRFTKSCRFSSNIFEMRRHFQTCPGDLVEYGRDDRDKWYNIVQWMIEPRDDGEDESDDDNMWAEGFVSDSSSDGGYDDEIIGGEAVEE